MAGRDEAVAAPFDTASESEVTLKAAKHSATEVGHEISIAKLRRFGRPWVTDESPCVRLTIGAIREGFITFAR
ncbi:hypothetical protein, partial [Xanthomonas hortorum]|uniref:hypothetical protein n=1 Tax=Xanthomonas hortorum TaxID=56454 RepID=UPI0020446C93